MALLNQMLHPRLTGKELAVLDFVRMRLRGVTLCSLITGLAVGS
jgi:hypothetical protein